MTYKPSRHRLYVRFVTGLAYTTFIANSLSVCTHCALPFTFACVLGIFAVFGGLGIWWLTLWARQKDARPGQFGIGSLLMLMIFVAVFLGTVRWIAIRVSEQQNQPHSVEMFSECALICLVIVVVSVPFILGMGEAVLWAAVWFIKQPHVRRLFCGWRKNYQTSIAAETQDT